MKELPAALCWRQVDSTGREHTHRQMSASAGTSRSVGCRVKAARDEGLERCVRKGAETYRPIPSTEAILLPVFQLACMLACLSQGQSVAEAGFVEGNVGFGRKGDFRFLQVSVKKKQQQRTESMFVFSLQEAYTAAYQP